MCSVFTEDVRRYNWIMVFWEQVNNERTVRERRFNETLEKE